MEYKPAFNFAPDVKTKVTLKFDTPREVQTKYGPKLVYGAMINGQDETFFATDSVHADLSRLKKGDTAYITMKAIIGADGKARKSYIVETAPISTQVAGKIGMANKETSEQEKWDRLSWGKCKTLFLVEAFKTSTPLSQAEPMAEEWADACMRMTNKARASKAMEAFKDIPVVATIDGGTVTKQELDDWHPTDNDDPGDIKVENIPF